MNHTPTLEELGPLPKATNRADLELMADAMRMLKDDRQTFFALSLVTGGLMNLTFEDPSTKELIEAAKSAGRLTLALRAMFHYAPESAAALVENAIKHMLLGKDETSPDSAGGWNQDELETAYAALYVARDGLTIPFGVNVQ